ncbi:receptor-like protein 49 [Ziziphus jujuba]|uniref:Receptor-like protein 49 n=1 Tax=Ziziphus jujuba TaxID=326968 RepID=A0ABM3ZTQ7_ZIZJJ|nr:receptor-like protein 49 [Ziziphus jujuba]
MESFLKYVEGNASNNLMLIDLSYNQLQGQLPRSLSNCMMLEGILVSNNRLNDVFPTWLGSLPKLKLLTVCKNEFYGEIGNPEKDFEFPKLQMIDLSYNNFSGELPSRYIFTWNSMKPGFLARFNVSHNNLTGPIPQGKQFNTFDNSSFEGNPGLCGNPLSRKRGDLQFSPTPTSTSGQVDDSEFLFILDWKFSMAGFMSGLVVEVVLGNIMITRRHAWLEKILSRMSRGRWD